MNTINTLSFEEAKSAFVGFDEDLEAFEGASVKILEDAEAPEGFDLPEGNTGEVLGFSGDYSEHLVVRVDGNDYIIDIAGIEIVD